MNRPLYYNLDGQPCGLNEAAVLMVDKRRIIDQTKVGKAMVSTVFLAIDHQLLGDGPPLIYETMIFGGKYDNYQERYSTRAEAEAGHARVVKALKEARPWKRLIPGLVRGLR